MKTKTENASSRADEIFRLLSLKNPAPETELYHTNPYTLLVAVVLSAQATDSGVNKATPALFKAADTPRKMLALGEKKLRWHIKTIGLFNSKARHIMALSRKLVEKHGGAVPDNIAALQALPGVGRKTANVVLNCVFGQPVIAVDTHVFRVSNRIGITNSPTPLKTELELDRIVPARWKQHAHHWLILHGRYVCKARKPLCSGCVIRDLCLYSDKSS